MTRKGIVAGEPDHTGLGRRPQRLQRLLRRFRPYVGRHERPEATDGQAELELPGRPGPILLTGLVGVTLIGMGMAGLA
jgi:hypothetical protein